MKRVAQKKDKVVNEIMSVGGERMKLNVFS